MEGPASAIGRFVRDQPAEAAARLRAVLADDPRNAEAWRLLGTANVAQNDFKRRCCAGASPPSRSTSPRSG